MTTTTRKTPPPGTTAPVKAPGAAEIAALIADAPEPRPTLLRTFGAMMAREFRVLRRNAIATFTRAVMQPLLFVFVFAYVFPKIGGGFNLGGGAAAAGAWAAGVTAGGSVNFATILVPGLMASMLLMQGIMAVTFPLVMEFGWTREIDLQVAVADPAFWSAHNVQLATALRFLTTDLWTLTFLNNGILPAPPKAAAMPRPY